MFFVYVIKSSRTGRYYTGSCSNIEKRLRDHNSSRVISTKNKGPYRLIHKEEFLHKQEALKREKQIKSYKGGRTFKKLISSPSSSLVQDIRFSF